jgi:predicted dehydrogenase
MIKAAVVGFGFMGITHTINIINNRKLKLIAIVDKNMESIEKNFSERTGNFSTGNLSEESLSGIIKYSSIDDCLANGEIDAYFICVHTDLHYEMSMKALMAGKHVFMEKPISLNIGEGQELITQARTRNQLLMVGQVVRFMPAYRQFNQWLVSGEFGPLKFLSLSRFSGLPAWGQWKEKQSAFGSSGGALFDLVIHDIDFVQSVLGEPDSIQSTILPGKLSNYDYVSALWNYKTTGVNVKIEGGNTFHSAYPFHAGFSAQFHKASLLYTSLQPEFITISKDSESIKVPAGDANSGFSDEIDYFASCIESKVQPDKCSPESALRTIQLCYDHLI